MQSFFMLRTKTLLKPRAYAASQTTVLHMKRHMKRLNQTESPIFVILCVFMCSMFPKAILFDIYLMRLRGRAG